MFVKRTNKIYSCCIKRLLDIVLASFAIIALAPLILVIALLVSVMISRSIIFKQNRPGFKEKIFTLYKFRTMSDEKDGTGNLLPDELRLTKFGKFLRSSSLDELPELYNILKGDMSIIGPRPLLVQYLPLYDEYQRHRHDVAPGLSGWAQVNGRNAISWEEKFRFDIEYVNNITFKKDIQICLLTIKKIISQEGINSETAATMEPFRGNINERVELNE